MAALAAPVTTLTHCLGVCASAFPAPRPRPLQPTISDVDARSSAGVAGKIAGLGDLPATLLSPAEKAAGSDAGEASGGEEHGTPSSEPREALRLRRLVAVGA